jgi:oxygen-independent coproporphyrinogen-3 oxidase
MPETFEFDQALIQRYDKAGPRYTSYPTAPQFSADFDESQLRRAITRSNNEMIPKPLSLYVHIPFCDTVCFYCACNKIVTKNHAVTPEYLQLLDQEMRMLAPLFDSDRELEQLHLGGGTPTFLNQDEMKSLMRSIGQSFNLADDCEMSIEIDPRKVTNDSIRELAQMGFNRMSLGVQDFDAKVQQAVNRVQPYEMVRERLESARDAGIVSVNMDLIYGLPHQSVETFGNTLDQVLGLRPDRLSVFNYAHLPERFKPQRRIDQVDLPEPAEKLDILQMMVERLQAAGYVYIGMDHFALETDSMVKAQQEGTLQRNFQGYSTHADADLIAIGVSSISLIGDSYSQNATGIDDYRASINAGKLPVVRGLTMNDDDRLRKAVITQLICHFRLDIPLVEQQWGINFKKYFAEEYKELRELERDGLLKLDPNSIRVEPKGRFLIRNVCMVFDAYLKTNKTVKFSKVI